MTITLITIPIGSDGTEMYTAQIIGEVIAPGLAVTPLIEDNDGPAYTGGWTLTHIESGMRINGGQYQHCLGCIREYAKAAAECGIDWTQPQPVVTELMNAGGPAVDALKEAHKYLAECAGTTCGPDFPLMFVPDAS